MREDLLLNAALEYAKEGYWVFPLHTPQGRGCSCGKASCSSPGKHPRIRRGFLAASSREDEIRSWWTKYPLANIGIATGSLSNLFVVDIDDHHGGHDSFVRLLEEAGESWPETRTIETGNGFHLWFLCPGLDIKSTTDLLGPGIDIRAEGGCVVAPPSLHSSGTTYAVARPNTPVAPVPDWLLQRLLREGAQANDPSESSLIPVGSRNVKLTSVAGKLRSAGMSEEQIFTNLLEQNSKCAEPLGVGELRAICRSVSRYPAGPQLLTPSQHSGTDNPLYWFPFNLRNWHEDIRIACMTAEQRGWYVSLLVYAWSYAGRLPADISILAKLANSESVERFAEHCELVISQFDLVEVDGTQILVHNSLAGQYAEKLASWEQKREAGLASAAAKKLPKKAMEGSDE